MNAPTNQSWLKLSALFLGGALSLPVLMVGFQLTKTYGFIAAMSSLVMGNVILAVTALVIARITLATRLNTVELAARVFGAGGRQLFAVVMTLLMVGWFALQLDIIGVNVSLLLSNLVGITVSPVVLNLAIGMLTAWCTVRGINALGLLSQVLIIPIALIIIAAIRLPTGSLGSCTVGFAGVSLVVAVMLGLVIDLPTYLRFSPSWAHAVATIITTFFIGLTVIETAGALYALASPATTIGGYLFTGNVVWSLCAAGCFITSGLLANLANNYSASVSIRTLIPRGSHTLFTVATAGVGIVLACMGVVQRMQILLEVMGVFMASMSAVTIAWWFTGPTRIASVAWLLGISAGLAAVAKLWTFTTFAMLDAALVAGSAYGILIVLRKLYETYQR